MNPPISAIDAARTDVDGRYAWLRLLATLLLSTAGTFGVWAVVVVLPTVQSEFGVQRAGASFPYTMTMIGFGLGGILMGRVADRVGMFPTAVFATVALGIGCLVTAQARTLWEFAFLHGAIIGFLASSAMFSPLVADISHWFERRRGLAVAVVASGNYLSGAIWPPIIHHLVAGYGWRSAYMIIGGICVAIMLPLTLALRRRPSTSLYSQSSALPVAHGATGLSPRALQSLLVLAGLACCIAMSMPQVHIVAYCGDLGYGPARGAEMLSLMLGFGVVSRLASGWISDRIGGLRTLLLGSLAQLATLTLFLPFDGLASLYLISILFGLSQGGIVPSYALVVRELFPAREAGERIGLVLSATVLGMAVGGWLTGLIFDLSGSYQLAFVHGLGWNLINLSIACWLLWRVRRATLAQVAT